MASNCYPGAPSRTTLHHGALFPFAVRSWRRFSGAVSNLSWELIRWMRGAGLTGIEIFRNFKFKNFRFEIGIPESVKAAKVHHACAAI